MNVIKLKILINPNVTMIRIGTPNRVLIVLTVFSQRLISNPSRIYSACGPHVSMLVYTSKPLIVLACKSVVAFSKNIFKFLSGTHKFELTTNVKLGL